MDALSDEDCEIQCALDDFHEGLRTGCGARAAHGMRRLGVLEGSNIAFLLGMFRGDGGLYTIYQLEFERNPVFKPTAPIIQGSSLANSIAAGQLQAVTQHLEDATMVDEADVKLIAKLLEGGEQTCPYLLRLVQRRSGPPVDELAAKAKWFRIYNVFREVNKPGMQQKEAVWLVQKHFSGRNGFGKSTIYKALRYFRPRGKEKTGVTTK